jgi:hypothetical protein
LRLTPLLNPVLKVADGVAANAKFDEMQHLQIVMRSRPTTISPEKFFRTSSTHMASVIKEIAKNKCYDQGGRGLMV